MQTRIKFWLAIVRTCIDTRTFEFSTNLITSILADPNICLQDISKKLLNKLSDKYLKIALQALSHEATCIDEQKLIALSTLLFENPLNESIKIPQVLHFITHRFGLGLLMKKLGVISVHSEKFPCFKDICKQLNVDLDNEHNLMEDDNARISFFAVKAILAYPEKSLSEDDASWLVQLAFTKIFWSLILRARHQVSLGILCCWYNRPLPPTVSLRYSIASSKEEKVKIALVGKHQRIQKRDYLRRRKEIVSRCPGILYVRKLKGYSHSVFDDATLKGYSSKHNLWCRLRKTTKNKKKETLRIGNSAEQTLSVFQTLSFWGCRNYYYSILGMIVDGDALGRILQNIYQSRRFNLDHHEIPYLEEFVKDQILLNFCYFHDNKVLQSCMLQQPAFLPFI